MGKPFSKILIANRGEIAVRIIRAARELGVSTVAIYSTADKDSLHVRLADEAYEIGPPEPLQSYLDMEKIIDIALKSGAEAIHPGYGFLAENPTFAELVEKHGLAFIGPPSKALKLAGDKVEAKRIARKADVPVVPGSVEPVTSVKDGMRIAEKIGYPILLKPAGGGGGIGIKIVRSPEKFTQAFEISQREAVAAFGDPRIYIEKYLENVRHIEVQILADMYGNIIYLGERECSIQRRYQKLIEEAPSTVITEELRREMGEAAIRVASASGYYNAGTIEFLFKDGKFYFMEVNARLQVEHGITELITGIDLVKQQLFIASGERLELEQKDVKIRGWAMEARINAEDPANNFAPSPGRILKYREPGGPGVRVDSGVYEGFEVSRYYDPLIAKVMTWGIDRKEALTRMRRALSEYVIIGDGIRTNIPFHQFVFNDEEFIRGDVDTNYVNRKVDEIVKFVKDIELKQAAIATYVLTRKPIALKTTRLPVSEVMYISWWKYSGLASLVKPWYKR